MYNVPLILSEIRFVGFWIKWPIGAFSVLASSIHYCNPDRTRWLQKQPAAFALGRPKTELSERVFPVFLLNLENVRLFGSGGLLFQSPRTAGMARDLQPALQQIISNSKLLASWIQKMLLKELKFLQVAWCQASDKQEKLSIPILPILPRQACLLCWSCNESVSQNEEDNECRVTVDACRILFAARFRNLTAN